MKFRKLLDNKLFILGLLFLTILLYGTFLQKTPIHLNQDELGFALNAHSIAKTGFDENGRFMPMYFWHLDLMWATPVIVYLTAAILTIFPLSEISIRLPSVIVGLANIVLIYFLAKEIFKSKLYGLIAAFFLTLIPVHFIQSRILLDNLYLLPFQIGWLLSLVIFLKYKKTKYLLLGLFLLGVGIHSYHSAKIMMSLYFILTLVTVTPELIKKKWLIIPCFLAFIIPLIPLYFWLEKYPDTLVDQVKYTRLYDTNLTPIQGFLSLINPNFLNSRLIVYINYFNPIFLFLKGDISLIHSTQKVGVFLLAFIILIPLGFFNILKYHRIRFNLVLIVGFLSAPLAAALVGENYRISRALVMLPFATLIVVYGFKYLLDKNKNFTKILSAFLILSMIFQFGIFLVDYYTDYQKRSYAYFKFNIPETLEKTIELDKSNEVNKIYLDGRVWFIDRYWKFYLIKHSEDELFEKTQLIYPKHATLLEKNSLLIYRSDYMNFAPETLFNVFKIFKSIKEPDGNYFFYIYKN